MNRDELITILREEYLDDVSDNPEQDEDDYRWSTSFLSRALATSEMEACRRANLIFDNSTVAVCTITLVSGTHTHTLHDKITKLEQVIYDGEPLDQRSRHITSSRDGPSGSTQPPPTMKTRMRCPSRSSVYQYPGLRLPQRFPKSTTWTCFSMPRISRSSGVTKMPRTRRRPRGIWTTSILHLGDESCW